MATHTPRAPIPNLSGLRVRELAPTGAPGTDAEGGKRKRFDDDEQPKEPEVWNFKAWQKDPGRYLLSNLAGPVEWAYQRSKFRRADEVRDGDGKPGVYEWLEEGERMEREGEWTRAKFEPISQGMKIGMQKNESYVKGDGTVLSGIFAQATKALVLPPAPGKPESDNAVKRLGFILGRKVSKGELSEWRSKNVKPDTTTQEKIELMEKLVKDKYTLGTKYADALLATGDKVLHESTGRGAPSLWEHKELSEETLAANPGFTPGGDMLGKLLMARREELRREEEEASKRTAARAGEEPSS